MKDIREHWQIVVAIITLVIGILMASWSIVVQPMHNSIQQNTRMLYEVRENMIDAQDLTDLYSRFKIRQDLVDKIQDRAIESHEKEMEKIDKKIEQYFQYYLGERHENEVSRAEI